MTRITLCLNCLLSPAVPVPVGPEKGTQWDPYRHTIDLCVTCRDALLEGNFATLACRYTPQRTISVSAQGER